MARTRGIRRLAGAAALAFAATPVLATDGYFALGYGTIQQGQAGTGVANGEDAMSTAVNPAGVASVGTELSLGLEAFRPVRGYTASGAALVKSREVGSQHAFFPVPNFAFNKALGNGGVLNFAMYGNGGNNTDYQDMVNPNCAIVGGGSGVFCGGTAGVNLSQLFMSVTYAQKFGPVSLGISPTLVVQEFSAYGLGKFAGISSDPAHLTNMGSDFSHGIGLRIGAQVDVAPGLRFGLSAQTKTSMSKFAKYAGLFENHGSFDVPASVTAGLAWDARPDLTLMLDYQRIWYSKVPALGNTATAGALGLKGGAGFGWKDVNVVKLGASWKQSDKMTWRFGYAYSTNPIPPSQVTFNILAPGVTRSHFTAGATYKMNSRDQIDFALQFVPEGRVSGPEVTPFGVTPGSDIKLAMHQYAVSIGWTRKF